MLIIAALFDAPEKSGMLEKERENKQSLIINVVKHD